MKTIKEAYEALNGDLKNSHYPKPDDKYLAYSNQERHYICLSYKDKEVYEEYDRQYICTVEEFNNYKGDTVKDKMIPFDLERALAGDKVVTRDGREVTQLTKFDLDMNTNMFYVAAVVDGGILCRFSQYGLCSEHNGSDLFMAPKKLSGFVVGFSSVDGKSTFSNTFATKDAADKFTVAGVHKVYCIDLSTIEEGHGL